MEVRGIGFLGNLNYLLIQLFFFLIINLSLEDAMFQSTWWKRDIHINGDRKLEIIRVEEFLGRGWGCYIGITSGIMMV